MNSRGCNSTPEGELNSSPLCTLSGLAQCTGLSQCSYNAPCPSARFLLSTTVVCLWPCTPARTLLSCSFPCTPRSGHRDWPRSLLTHSPANRTTGHNTHLCRDAPEAPGQHTCAKGQCKPRCCVHSHAFMCMLHQFSPLSLAGKPLQAKAQSMEAAVISRLSFKAHKWTKIAPRTFFFLFVEL